MFFDCFYSFSSGGFFKKMTYDFISIPDLLADPICWEGVWSEIPLPTCQKVRCYHCNNNIGYAFVSCLFCQTKISQCNLITLHGICRVREDHMCGYPVAHICTNCFPSLNNMLSNIRLAVLQPLVPRSVYEPLKKWIIAHWNFFQIV